eukprot:298813-Amphidinium_carterae.3
MPQVWAEAVHTSRRAKALEMPMRSILSKVQGCTSSHRDLALTNMEYFRALFQLLSCRALCRRICLWWATPAKAAPSAQFCSRRPA